MSKGKAFVCGWQPRRVGKRLLLTKAEKKAISNFSKYLRGQGSRCCECLHKADRHWVTCGVAGCGCIFSSGDVYATRAQVKAPGWEKDKHGREK